MMGCFRDFSFSIPSRLELTNLIPPNPAGGARFWILATKQTWIWKPDPTRNTAEQMANSEISDLPAELKNQFAKYLEGGSDKK